MTDDVNPQSGADDTPVDSVTESIIEKTDTGVSTPPDFAMLAGAEPPPITVGATAPDNQPKRGRGRPPGTGRKQGARKKPEPVDPDEAAAAAQANAAVGATLLMQALDTLRDMAAGERVDTPELRQPTEAAIKAWLLESGATPPAWVVACAMSSLYVSAGLRVGKAPGRIKSAIIWLRERIMP